MRSTRAGRVSAFVAALAIALPAAGQSQNRNWPSERPPRPLAAHDVKFPPYAFRTLGNGLQVLAVSHHEQPAVSLRLIVRAGGAQDPDDKSGVASLAASLLDQGTTTKSEEQIANAIDSIGGALGTGASADLSSINCIVMKDSLSVGLDLVSDLAQHPAFAKEEVERQRQQTLSAMQVSNDDPEYLANTVFDRLVYGLHPYGKPQSGSPATIAALTRDDLLAFHRGEAGMPRGRMIHTHPPDRPEEPGDPGREEHPSPIRDTEDQRDGGRRDDGPDRGARVDDPHRERSLARRKPFGHRLGGGGKPSALAGAQQEPADEERPVSDGQAMAGRRARPRDHDDEEAAARAEPVHERTPARVHERVRKQKRRLQLRKLGVRERDLALDRGDRHRKRLAIEVADRDGRAEGDRETPALSTDGGFSCLQRHGCRCAVGSAGIKRGP